MNRLSRAAMALLVVMTACTGTPAAPDKGPEAVVGPDQTVSAGDTVTLDGSGSYEASGHALTYSWSQTAGTSVALSGASTAQPTFVAPATASALTLTFQLVVSDGTLTGMAQTNVTVNPANRPPHAVIVAPASITAGGAVVLDGSGSSDPDGDHLSFQWTQTAGTPVTLSSATAAKPGFDAPGAPTTLTFSLVVTDSHDLASAPANASVAVLAAGVNHAPNAVAGAGQTVNAGASVTLDGSASSDPDGDAITFKWTQTAGTPVTLSSATAAKPTFTAPAGAATLTFSLVVTDSHGLASAAASTSVTVLAPGVNHAPTAVVGADQTVNAGAPVTLDGSGSSDPDGDSITYAWTQTGGTSVTLSSSSVASPSFTAPAAAATLIFSLVVTDSHGLASSPATATVTVQLVNVNHAPSAVVGPDQTVNTGAAVTLDGSGSSDPDGDPITFKWTQTAGTSVTLSSSSVASPSFTAPAAATTLTFSLVVTDSHGLASTPATATVNVQAASVNHAPIAVAGANQTVSAGALVTLDGSASSDPDGDAITYQWTQSGSTSSVTLSSASAAKPTFTAPSAAATLTFSLVVTDSHGLASNPATTTVTVQPPAVTCSGGASTGNFLKEPSLHALTRTGVVVFFMTSASLVAQVDYGVGAYTATAKDPSATGRHVIQLTGLAPNTQYAYKVTAGASNATGCFYTAPDYATSPASFSFAVGGDSRGNDTEWTKISNAILAKNPRFYVATGDNNNSNGADSAWQSYFNVAKTMFRNLPYFAAMGNHDYYSSWSTYNVSPQSSSGSDSYYAMVYANAGFVAINANIAYGSGSAQNTWVKTALQTFKGGPLFAFQHQPLYSCGNHGSDTSLQSAFQSLFEQNGVATSFNGHDHDLIFWSTINNVRYVVSGGGGTSLYSLSGCQGPYKLEGYGFMIVEVNGASVTETFYGDTGNVLYANPAFNAAGTAIDFTKIGSLTSY